MAADDTLDVTSLRPRIVHGISGAVSAANVHQLILMFRQLLGATVQVVATRSALRFITPTTIHVYSGKEALLDHFKPPPHLGPVPHIELTDAADLVFVGPATANVISKLALGIADDALSTVLLSARIPVILAPSMNERMWNSPLISGYIQKISSIGHVVLPPTYGTEMSTLERSYGVMSDFTTIVRELGFILRSRGQSRTTE